jgi:hypothetical protein
MKLNDCHAEQMKVMARWMNAQKFKPTREGIEAPGELTYAGISRVSSRAMRIPMNVTMFGLDEIEEMEGYDLAVRY